MIFLVVVFIYSIENLACFKTKLQPIDMSCKIVPHKPLDGKFAKCALRNVVGKCGRKDIEDVGFEAISIAQNNIMGAKSINVLVGEN